MSPYIHNYHKLQNTRLATINNNEVFICQEEWEVRYVGYTSRGEIFAVKG